MQIIALNTNEHRTSTQIYCTDKDGRYVDYTYDHVFELLRDPKNPREWAQWNGGSLNDALQYIINL